MTLATSIRAAFMMFAVAASTPAIATAEWNEKCEKLAAAPDEPPTKGAGVALRDIDSPAAVFACYEAARRGGSLDSAIIFRLGRAYMAPGSAQNIQAALVQSGYTWGTAKTPGEIARLGADVAEWYRSRGEKGLDPSSYAARAEAGDADAQMALYFLYSGKRFGRHDMAEAEKWLPRALEQRHPAALVVVAHRLIDSPDRKLAERGVRLMYEAASRNYGLAQYDMAELYLRGKIVPKDEAVGIRWLQLAAANSDEEARHWLKQKEKQKLNTDVATALLALAAIWAANMMMNPSDPEIDNERVDRELREGREKMGICAFGQQWDPALGKCEQAY